MILAAAIVLRLQRAKGVLTHHPGLGPGNLARIRALRRCVLRLGLSPFPRIICVNPQIRETLMGLGIRDSRLSVIPAYPGLPTPVPLFAEDADMITGLSHLIAAA